MLGNESVPHWFRRAISILNQEIQVEPLRPSTGSARSRAAMEKRHQEARRQAALSRSGRPRGPQALEAIVQSWEEQQAQKALARGRSGRW